MKRNAQYAKSIAHEGIPVAIYNAEEKRLIALFKSGGLATPFVFGPYAPFAKNSHVSTCARDKGLILPRSSIHQFKIAVRYATAKQLTMLGDRLELLL